jgi:hypothetical protein
MSQEQAKLSRYHLGLLRDLKDIIGFSTGIWQFIEISVFLLKIRRKYV